MSSLVAAGVLAWLIAAIAVGASGLLGALRPPVPQIMLIGITAMTLLVVLGARSIRSWALAVDARVLVAFHLTRFVGFYFLVLHQRGELPYRFAVVGGWGDIAVACLALGLLAAGPPTAGWRRHAYSVWNSLGLIDIVFVVVTAARSTVADPVSMRPLQVLPLNLLLTYFVPIILVTHLLLGYRFRRDRMVEAAP